MICLGATQIAKGKMSQGLQLLKKGQKAAITADSKGMYAQSENILGAIYMQLAMREAPINFSTIAKNIGFLAKNIPIASKKAEEHFNKAIEVAREIGAKGILGMTYLDLGLLYKLKKKTGQAKECISESIKIFEQCEAEAYLKQAKNALESL